MMKSTSAANWTMAKIILLGVPLILLLLVNNSSAAPANSNEDQIGFGPAPRSAFRTHENNPPLVDYNSVQVVPETGIPLDAPVQQSVDINLLNYLLTMARHAGLNSRPRYYSDMDSGRNELARKRSTYSKYCAFNAVSCFGRKK